MINGRINIKNAFTLAETLITLVIIGIISALIIPSVIKNYNDKKYNTARLKALKTFGEAGKIASINGEINGQPSARAFVENVLSKYLKIIKVCDTAAECNFPDTFRSLNPTETEHISDNIIKWVNLNNYLYSKNSRTPLGNTSLSVYVISTDGLSAKIFYNPKCVANSHENPDDNECRQKKDCGIQGADVVCMNVIYDMNGTKAPNHVGEDIGFVTTFWSGIKATSVAPGILKYELNAIPWKNSYLEASNYCSSLGNKKTQYSLPSIDELTSMYLNLNFTSMPRHNFWSASTVFGRPGYVWCIGTTCGRGQCAMNNNMNRAWCVRR